MTSSKVGIRALISSIARLIPVFRALFQTNAKLSERNRIHFG